MIAEIQADSREPITALYFTLNQRYTSHRDPVPLPDARVTNDIQQRLVRLELLHSASYLIGGGPRYRLVGEHLAHLVHHPEHVAQIRLYLSGVQLTERPYTYRQNIDLYNQTGHQCR